MDFCDLITYQSDQNIFQSFLEHFNREKLALQEAENFTVFITVRDGKSDVSESTPHLLLYEGVSISKLFLIKHQWIFVRAQW